MKIILSKIVAGLAVMSLLTGCTGKRNDTMDIDNCHGFSKTSQAEWRILLADEVLPLANNLYATDSSIVLLGLLRGYWLHEYDLSSGRHVASHVTQGQGPGEVVNALNISSANDSTFEIYDIGVFKAIKFNKSHYEPIAATNVRPLFRTAWNVWDLGENRQLVKAPYFSDKDGARRAYAIVNEAIDTAYYIYHQIPEIFSAEPMALLMQSVYAVSPDKKHFASATTVGGALELFTIEGDSIAETFWANPYPLKFNNNRIEGEPVIGFTALCCSNKDVYAAFAGTTNGADATKIGVWNWDGTSLEQIDTDYPILSLALQQSSGKIFGLIETEDGFKLASLEFLTNSVHQ